MLPTFQYSAKIINVVDGDTVDAIIDLGFRISITIRVRLFGINAPEKNRKDSKEAGMASMEFLKEKIDNMNVVIKTFKNPEDKYGRWLGIIYLPDQEDSINDLMIKSGHAVPMVF